MKKLVAYSSVSHLGYVMLGILAFNLQGVEGAIFQMLSHGLATGGLFLLVGVLYERRHTREIKEWRGLARRIPLFSTVFLIFVLSSIGLPGLNGFVGEFLILLGTFRTNKFFCFLGGTGIILGAVYLLWLTERILFGPAPTEKFALPDLKIREALVCLPLVVLMVTMGVYPRPFLTAMESSVRELVHHVKDEIRDKAMLSRNNQ
jgi:NADH-quinone oxidoreductase subunit M